MADVTMRHMAIAYLITNTLLYLALAAWCIVSPQSTSQAVGFSLISGSGRSEYLVVYGGLQIGLAIFFALCAYYPMWTYMGIVFGCCLYCPILICRIISFLKFEGIGNVTIGTGILELVLTISGLYLLWSLR